MPAGSDNFLKLLLDNQVLVLFAVITTGLALGAVRIKRISLGTSGVIFSALAFGALGCSVPAGIGTVGLVLFVYCVGLAAGPTFFRVFAQRGATFVKLGLVLIFLGAATAVVTAWLLKVPTDLAAGIFAGAMTSTPALAAALEYLPEPGAVTIGYGLAYPVGVVAVVLLVQVLPRLLRQRIDEQDTGGGNGLPRIETVLVEVVNPAVCGKPLAEIHFIADQHCQVTRVMEEGNLEPVQPGLVLEPGMHLMLIGCRPELDTVTEYLGRVSDRHYTIDTESERMRVVVTAREAIGRTLAELAIRRRFHVTVSRVVRHDIEFIPSAGTRIEHTDVLIVIGEAEDLKRFSDFAGHRARALDETDLIYLGLGITLGAVAALFPIVLPGLAPFTLGMAGGPLLVALIIGHTGRIGRVHGHVPRAARNLLQNIGLIFFLAGAGAGAGSELLSVLADQGLALIAMAALTCIVPMVGGLFFARLVLKLDLLEILGGICGGMTSTPGLGTITSRTDSELPVVSYAGVYPVALIMMTLVVQAVIAVLSRLVG